MSNKQAPAATISITKMVVYAGEAAALLNCSVQTIYALIHAKKLRAYKDAGRNTWQIPVSALYDYINLHFQE